MERILGYQCFRTRCSVSEDLVQGLVPQQRSVFWFEKKRGCSNGRAVSWRRSTDSLSRSASRFVPCVRIIPWVEASRLSFRCWRTDLHQQSRCMKRIVRKCSKPGRKSADASEASNRFGNVSFVAMKPGIIVYPLPPIRTHISCTRSRRCDERRTPVLVLACLCIHPHQTVCHQVFHNRVCPWSFPAQIDLQHRDRHVAQHLDRL